MTIARMARAVYAKVGTATILEDSNGGVVIESVSRQRAACWLLLQFIRISIALSLLVAGLLFLINTSAIPDLLLNTVALEFIMGIDEVCFQYTPLALKNLLSSVEPLPIKIRTFRKMDRNCTIAVTGVIAPFWVHPPDCTILAGHNLMDPGSDFRDAAAGPYLV